MRNQDDLSDFQTPEAQRIIAEFKAALRPDTLACLERSRSVHGDSPLHRILLGEMAAEPDAVTAEAAETAEVAEISDGIHGETPDENPAPLELSDEHIEDLDGDTSIG